MSEAMRILQRGYEMTWREDRLEDALIHLDPEFQWVVPGHPEGDVDWELHPAEADRVYDVDEALREAGLGRQVLESD